MSFPSGHSSTAFAGVSGHAAIVCERLLTWLSLPLRGLGFLFLFLAAKMRATLSPVTSSLPQKPQNGISASRLVKLGFIVSPLGLASWIAMSRVQDHVRLIPYIHSCVLIYLVARSSRRRCWRSYHRVFVCLGSFHNILGEPIHIAARSRRTTSSHSYTNASYLLRRPAGSGFGKRKQVRCLNEGIRYPFHRR